MDAATAILVRRAKQNIATRLDPSTGLSIQIQDRYTTTWTGYEDPRAMDFGLYVGTVKAIKDMEGVVVEYQLDPLCKDNNHIANEICDEIRRIRHGHDRSLETGIGFGKTGWKDQTRGQKLRFFKAELEALDLLAYGVGKVITEIESVIGGTSNLASAGYGFRCAMAEGIPMEEVVELLKKDMKRRKILREMLCSLGAMVQDETNDGWDWVAGLDKQAYLLDVYIKGVKKFSHSLWNLLFQKAKEEDEAESTPMTKAVKACALGMMASSK